MLDLQNDKDLTINDKNKNEFNSINHVTIIDDTVVDSELQESLPNIENMNTNNFSKEPIFSNSNNVENNTLNTTSYTSVNINNTNINDTYTPESNCLALTVRKDYNLVIVKNIFTASGRLSWKIVLATVILNILNMLF